MRKIPRMTVLLLIVSASGALTAESPREAVELALKHAPEIQSAVSGAAAARLEASSAEKSLLPALTLGAHYQYTSADAELSVPAGPGGQTQTVSLVRQHSIDTSAGIRWAAFTGFAQEANVELKRLSALLAANTLESARTQTALKTVTAFRQAQAAQLQIDSLQSGRKRTELQLDQTKTLVQQGMAKELDVLSLRIALSDFDQRLVAAQANLADAAEQLRSLTGKDIRLPAAPVTETEATLPALDIESLDTVRALGIRRSLLLTNRKLALSKKYPTLSLNGMLHFGRPGANPVENAWMLYATVGASLSWSYDWGAASLAVRAADQNLAKLSSDETAARDAVRLEFEKAVRGWKALKEEADILKTSLDLTRTKMNIVKSQLEQGMASTTEFTDSNIELTQAELRYRSQLIALLLKANQIDALSGEPIEKWSLAQ